MKKRFIFFTLFLFLGGLMYAQEDVFPPRPDPPRAVNDYTGFLSQQDAQKLEQKLNDFTARTSTAIVIAIVPDLYGYDPSDYAFRLAEKWGVGQKGKNNGILVLVKPKTERSKGEVFIAVGYGLEGVVPDVVVSRIVRNEIIPRFQQGDYAGGLEAAVNILIGLTGKEFTADEYMNRKGNTTGGVIAVVLLVLVIVLISAMTNARRSRHYSVGKTGVPWWVWLMMANSGSKSHRGSWGNFSSGSGMFGGGGGGGFGGFGGGSFGGGGAGGSW
ncbi:MAG: TPM domain-containing protein [Bacteroidales bacterium]